MPVDDRSVERLFNRPFLLLCAFVFFNAFAFQMLIPVVPLYLLEVGGEEWEAGLVMGVAALSALAARPAVGYFADNVGRVPLLRFAAISYIVMAALYPLARAVTPLLLVRLFQGLGLSAQSTAASTYAGDVSPPSRRGEAMGLFGSSMNVATAIGPLTGVWLAKSYSFNHVWALCAALSVAALVVALTMRDRFTPSRRHSPVATPGSGPHAPATGIERFFSREALYPSLLGLFFTASFGAIVSFLPLLTESRGIGNPGWFFLPYALTIIVTRVIAGRASDRWGRSVILVPGMAALAVGMLVLAASSGISMLLLSAFIYGIGFGTVHPALMAFVADRAAPGRLGVAMSTFTAAFDLGIGGGSVLWGGFVALGDERAAFYGGAAAALLGLAIVIGRLPGDRRAEAVARRTASAGAAGGS